MIEVRKLLLIAGMMASTVGATASVLAKDRSVERAPVSYTHLTLPTIYSV